MDTKTSVKVKYSPTPYWKLLLVICCVTVLAIFLPHLFRNPPDPSNLLDLIGVLAIILIFVFMPLYASFGLFITLSKDKLCRTDYFIWKKCLKIEDINTVRSWSSWGIGQTLRTFEIINEKRWNKNIELTSTAFSEKTIAKLMNDLKTHNPSIKLDGFTEELIKKYK